MQCNTKESPAKDFQLPSLNPFKPSSHTAKSNKRKHSFRLTSPSPHRHIASISVSETQSKLKHLIPPYISAKTWAVFNTSSETIIFGQGTEDRREIASLTKIMTCYLSIKLAEAWGIPLLKKIAVSPRAAMISGTSANLRAGDVLSLVDLLHALMLPSGNDAAYALAEFFGGLISQERPVRSFVAEMNRIAEELELANTRFRNPHGMSARPNFSTAKDVSILANLALKHSVFYEVVNKKEYCCQVKNEEVREIVWKSTNKLLGRGVDAGKTGQTAKAGPCLCVRFVHPKAKIIITVLGCKTNNSRWVEVPRLAEWALSKI